MFWNVCHAPQHNTPHQVYYQLNLYSLLLKYTKRTSMGSRSFTEHTRKCPNSSENKPITVNQGGFYFSWRALVWCMSSTRIYHSLIPTWYAPYKSTEVTLRYQVPLFNKNLFKVLESLWWNRTPKNTSVKPIPHMLDEIKVGTHCWSFHLLNVQLSQNSSGDARYMSQGIAMHEYDVRANIVCNNQNML
jgi:hypothetical protein